MNAAKVAKVAKATPDMSSTPPKKLRTTSGIDDPTRYAEIWPPRHFVEELMEQRGWTLKDLADEVGYGVKFFDYVMKCEPLREWDCRTLALAFGTSWEYWRNLDRGFRQALSSGQYHLLRNTESYFTEDI
jgi:plasmid maintenance system antidote protein VapI